MPNFSQIITSLHNYFYRVLDGEDSCESIQHVFKTIKGSLSGSVLFHHHALSTKLHAMMQATH